MGYQFGWYSYVLLLTTVVALFVAAICWQRRSSVGAVWLALLELGTAVWTFTVAFEAAAPGVEAAFPWSVLAYLGIASTPLFFFLFTVEYGQQGDWLTKRNIGLLAVIPVITFALLATNPWHHLHYSQILADPVSGVLVYHRGPWFWVFVAWAYSMLMVGVIVLVRALFRFPAFYRSQMWALLAGCVLPILANLVHVSGLNPLTKLDLTPVAFAVSGGILAGTVLRLRVFELAPVARTHLVESMADGVLVLDLQDRIVDINPAAERIFYHGQESFVGQPAKKILAHSKTFLDRLQAKMELQTEMPVGDAAGQATYDMQVSPLRDRHGKVVGRLVVLRDITRRKQMEQERESLILQLESALGELKRLSGLLPICANCKSIRDDQGYWQQVEVYVSQHSEAQFSHGLCPDCLRKLYPDYIDDEP